MLKQKFTASYQLYFIQQNENGFAPQIIFYDSEGMWDLSFFFTSFYPLTQSKQYKHFETRA